MLLMLHCSQNSTPFEFLRSLSWLEKKKKEKKGKKSNLIEARKFAFLDTGLRTALPYGRKHRNHNSNREIWFIVFKVNLAIMACHFCRNYFKIYLVTLVRYHEELSHMSLVIRIY